MVRIPTQSQNTPTPQPSQEPKGTPKVFTPPTKKEDDEFSLGITPDAYKDPRAQRAIQDLLEAYQNFKSLKPPIFIEKAIALEKLLSKTSRELHTINKDKSADLTDWQKYQIEKAMNRVDFACKEFANREQDPDNAISFIRTALDMALSELDIDH